MQKLPFKFFEIFELMPKELLFEHRRQKGVRRLPYSFLYQKLDGFR
ncbi:hypothetical protein HMPREF9088_1804 [Enterococcus italicus DSM 15952]|uniref:Uncharacterized protein n=1 Tax=Enterococcus italicus (strain DSM 15952 / CCUG 50447 / LMG 22039 / TP 1.5) TaxID=888064 RepID=E6LHG4_ENTI1|nr:hypothetical protein HMPREF9088_1804 [Enterococcus italicus DSM 15952]OJG57532.1 hypothetical protein RT43_GL001063 [Enterococcus italicus DSM 15952]